MKKVENLPAQPPSVALPEDHKERMTVYDAQGKAWRKWEEEILAAFEGNTFTLADVKAAWESAYSSGLERGADGGSSLASWLFEANKEAPRPSGPYSGCSNCERIYGSEEAERLPIVSIGEGGTMRDGIATKTFMTKSYKCPCGGTVVFTRKLEP